MQRIGIFVAASLLGWGLFISANGDDSPPGKQAATEKPEQPVSENEARARARLLHEAFHATLQFVHDEYYRPDQRLELPANTLERVFGELERSQKVRLRWLAVNAQAMNVEHAARDDFEKAAVASLITGKNEFDRLEKGTYRYAGAITLTSACLKCHLPARSDNRDRAAALVISIPLNGRTESP